MCLTEDDPNAAVYTAADTGLLLTQVFRPAAFRAG
jgi:hypothetical protein